MPPPESSESESTTATRRTTIRRDGESAPFEASESEDHLATESPLEIRVEGRSVAVVMRTPGHDEELTAGFLLTEGVIRSKEDLFEISRCPSISGSKEEEAGNVIEAVLTHPDRADLDALTRHVFSSSSCGICGKATIDSVFQSFPPVDAPDGSFSIPAATMLTLTGRLREVQATFEKTGGLHASALFTANGELHLVREDVGRHNALDKVLGHTLLAGKLPLGDALLLVSGRISFELAQKALAAGIPVIAGISAPSSLAVEFAERSNQTLVGFLRDESMNVYSHPERIAI